LMCPLRVTRAQYTRRSLRQNRRQQPNKNNGKTALDVPFETVPISIFRVSKKGGRAA